MARTPRSLAAAPIAGRFLVVSLVVLLVASGEHARADTPPPAAPEEGAAPAAGSSPVVPPGTFDDDTGVQRPADLSYGTGARLRWVTVPAWLLNLFTKKNVPLSSWGTGVSLFRRKGNFDLVGSITYQNMSPADGNWLGKNHDASVDTDLVQFRSFGLVGVDVSFIWHQMFNDWIGMHYGAGIGIGIVTGQILRTSDSSACTDQNAGDLSVCHPVNITCTGSSCNEQQLQATSGPASSDSAATPHRFVENSVPPVVPIVNVVLGVDFRLPKVRGWEATIEGGFYDAFFLGGAVGYTF
jgi:hypothetical protein